MASKQYPEDEFDRLPAKGGSPVGAHRASPKGWTRIVGFFAVMAIFAGAAYGVVQLLFNWDRIPVLSWIGGGAEPEYSPWVTEDLATIDSEPSVSPSGSLGPSAEATPEYRYGASVYVYSASSKSGGAGNTRDYIKSLEPFTKVSTGSWSGAKPTGNTIRYRSIGFRETAELLADILGIPTSTLGPVEKGDIEIVIVSNPVPEPEPSSSAG